MNPTKYELTQDQIDKLFAIVGHREETRAFSRGFGLNVKPTTPEEVLGLLLEFELERLNKQQHGLRAT